MTTNVFRGTLLECLRHYGELLPMGQKGIHESLAEFCGVGADTAYRWVRGKHPPLGENIFRCAAFLQSRGYHVNELQKLSPAVCKAVMMVARREVTADALQEALGVNRKTVLQILHGRRGMSKKVRRRLERFVAGGTKQETSPASAYQEPKTVDREASANGTGGHDAIIDALANQTRALLPLVKLVLTDAFTAEERHRLRHLVGGDGVFHLKNELSRLCSEKAREIL